MILILYGDVPLLTTASLQRLLAAATDGIGVLTARLPDPTGYGRIVRDVRGRLLRIVEHKDATVDELALTEINTGIMAVDAALLQRWIPGLGNDNAQGEYYLTDCVALAVGEGLDVGGARRQQSPATRRSRTPPSSSRNRASARPGRDFARPCPR